MLLTALVSLYLSAPTVAVPEGVTQESSVEGFTEYRLRNGLRVILAPDSSSPQVTVNLTVLVGSRHEDYGEKGMAHLFEHMLFKKTKKIADIKKTLTTFGGSANGTTSFDRTNYFEVFAASDQTLSSAIALEAERLVNAIVSREALLTEMTVVRNELERGENQPDAVLAERVSSAAFLWHNYGNTTIGTRSDIEQVPTERLQAFYEKYYQPDNALLIVAGKFDTQKTLQAIASAFGKIPKPKRTLPPQTYTVEPIQDGERSVTVRRVGGNPLFDVQYHVPAASDPDGAALEALTAVLGASPSGRLYNALIATKKAASVDCGYGPTRDATTLECTVGLGPQDSAAVAREPLLNELENLAKKPVTGAETERAKAQLLKQSEMTLNTPSRIGIALSEWAAAGDWRLFFIHRDRVKAVTVDDLNRVALRYLKPSNRTLGDYVPTEKPDRAEVPAMVDLAPVIKAYKPADAVTPGEVFEATPANIEARTARSTLKNGFKLVLLSKKTRGETVRVAMRLNFGSLKSLTNQRTAAAFLAQLLDRGTKTKTREQFKDALDALKANLRFAGEGQRLTATLEVRRPQLAAALDLLQEALRNPALDQKEFESTRREVIAAAQVSKDEPSAVGYVSLDRVNMPYTKEHPLYTPTFEERIVEAQELKLAAVSELHAKQYGAQSAQMAIVGDFDPAEISAKVNTLFGDWTAAQPYERIARPFEAGEAKNVTLRLADRANAFLGARLPVRLTNAAPDYPAMMIAEYMLGGGFMSGRVTQRLREKDGLSYGAGTYLMVPPLDNSATLTGYAIYAPQNVSKVENGFKEEIERAVTGGFSDTELKAALQGLKQNRLSGYADDGRVCTKLVDQADLGRTFVYEADLDAKLEKLSVSEVNATLKKYVDPKKISFIKAGDFKTVEVAK